MIPRRGHRVTEAKGLEEGFTQDLDPSESLKRAWVLLGCVDGHWLHRDNGVKETGPWEVRKVKEPAGLCQRAAGD
jgi:hypothetical protein